jgi:hypothetical protein
MRASEGRNAGESKRAEGEGEVLMAGWWTIEDDERPGSKQPRSSVCACVRACVGL